MKLLDKKIIVLVSFSLLVISSVTITFIFPLEKAIPFETISKGKEWNSGIYEESYLIINTQEKWENLWYKTFSTSVPIPLINFQNSTIIAVYWGMCGDTSYSIEIKRIVETPTYFKIYVQKIIASCAAAHLITFPYHIVNTQKLLKLNIVFITEAISYCKYKNLGNLNINFIIEPLEL
jgi:hypothetical protein